MSEKVAAERGAFERAAKPLFVATIVTGSFLLFLVQPMVARMALPRLGGAPAVWNSAMVVFQALLLAGYAYAHLIARVRPRLQAGIHIALFAVAGLWLPIGLLAQTLPEGASPAVWAPWFLFLSIGPLFFIASAQAYTDPVLTLLTAFFIGCLFATATLDERVAPAAAPAGRVLAPTTA